MMAQVVSGSKGGFLVSCEGEFFHCVLKGKRASEEGGRFYNPVAPGDFVELDDGKSCIVRILPRKNALLRRNMKSRFPQIIAANIDCAAVFATPSAPPFRPRFVDRVLLQCDFQKIPAVLVLNKIDLGIDPQVRARLDSWKKIGFETAEISAKSGEGLDALKSLLQGKTCAFVGQSGAGKSSAVNVLARASQKTAAISEKYERGNHVTTCGRLFEWEGGKLIDTPGIRSFFNWGISPESLAANFREVARFAPFCKFGASCSHSESEQGCAVRAALSSGEIDADRFSSYESILLSL